MMDLHRFLGVNVNCLMSLIIINDFLISIEFNNLDSFSSKLRVL